MIKSVHAIGALQYFLLDLLGSMNKKFPHMVKQILGLQLVMVLGRFIYSLAEGHMSLGADLMV